MFENRGYREHALRIAVGITMLVLILAGDTDAVKLTSSTYSDESNVVIKVLVINFDPIIESYGNQPLHQVLGWNDPHQLTQDYINDLSETSGNFAQYQIVEWIDVDTYPKFIDGFQYNDDTYLDVWNNRTPHQPMDVDYYSIITDYNLAARVASGEIDEVFMFGMPYTGYYESRMVGPGAYWVNSPGMPDIQSDRLFILMGFSYERDIGMMLENYGHRTESIMTHVYGSWRNNYDLDDTSPPKHNWDNFTLYEMVAPGNASCGNIHYAPNALRTGDEYDYGNSNYVWSTCDDWLYNWPDFNGTKEWVNGNEWGSGNTRLYLKWWFKHIPNKPGINPDGKQNNWWKYIADFNSYPESGIKPRIITVHDSGGADYTRIQDAVDDARDGDTILVYSGTYYENVNVNKSLTIIGADKKTTIISGAKNGDVISIAANDSIIKDLTIKVSGNYWYDAGIGIYGYNNSVTENIITENERGVKCWYGSCTVDNNLFTNNKNDAITSFGSSSIFVNNTITKNNIHGIVTGPTDGIVISNNLIEDNIGIGIVLFSNKTIVENNTVINNSIGISESENTDRNTIKDNIIRDNNVYGIEIMLSNNDKIHNNYLSNNYVIFQR